MSFYIFRIIRISKIPLATQFRRLNIDSLFVFFRATTFVCAHAGVETCSGYLISR